MPPTNDLQVRRFYNSAKDHLGAAILLTTLLGMLFVAIFFYLFLYHCPCQIQQLVKKEPPWVLLTALASAPSLLLTWYLRAETTREKIDIDDRQARLKELEYRTIEFSRLLENAATFKTPEKSAAALLILPRYINDIYNDNKDQGYQRSAITLICYIIRNASRQLKETVKDIDMYGNAHVLHCALEALGMARSHLSKVNLDRSYIALFSLAEANLEESHLDWAELYGVDFKGANLSKAMIRNSQVAFSGFRNASFENAAIADTAFSTSNFENAIFNNVHGPKCKFDWCTLTETHFVDANLIDASFCNSNLKGADFTKAQIWGVDFTSADLTGSKINLEYQNDPLMSKLGLKPATLENALRPEDDLQQWGWKTDDKGRLHKMEPQADTPKGPG